MLWWKLEVSLHYTWLNLWFQYIVKSSSTKSHYMFCAQSASMEIFVHRMNVRNGIRFNASVRFKHSMPFYELKIIYVHFLKKEMMVNWVVHLQNEFSYSPKGSNGYFLYSKLMVFSIVWRKELSSLSYFPFMSGISYISIKV